jgi:hypothetical protein
MGDQRRVSQPFFHAHKIIENKIIKPANVVALLFLLPFLSL